MLVPYLECSLQLHPNSLQPFDGFYNEDAMPQLKFHEDQNPNPISHLPTPVAHHPSTHQSQVHGQRPSQQEQKELQQEEQAQEEHAV